MPFKEQTLIVNFVYKSGFKSVSDVYFRPSIWLARSFNWAIHNDAKNTNETQIPAEKNILTYFHCKADSKHG